MTPPPRCGVALHPAQDAVPAEIFCCCGAEPEGFLASIAQDATKAQLKANTDEPIRSGASSSARRRIFVDGDEMYFGRDRLLLITSAVRRRLARG